MAGWYDNKPLKNFVQNLETFHHTRTLTRASLAEKLFFYSCLSTQLHFFTQNLLSFTSYVLHDATLNVWSSNCVTITITAGPPHRHLFFFLCACSPAAMMMHALMTTMKVKKKKLISSKKSCLLTFFKEKNKDARINISFFTHQLTIPAAASKPNKTTATSFSTRWTCTKKTKRWWT